MGCENNEGKCFKHPLYYNMWFKHERHNACRPQSMYARMLDQMVAINGFVLFYYPISEYDLDGLYSLWGEDPNKKYLEKYTLKALTDGENDPLTFNSYGVSKEEADRTIQIPKKMFTDVTGKSEPKYGDHYLWTQNNIVYQVENFTDQNNIVLGDELWWTIYSIPRLVEGEIYGEDDCNDMREDVIDPDPLDPDAANCPIDDGILTDNPFVHVPSAQSKKNDDQDIIDQQGNQFLRNSWGGFDD